MIPDTIKVVLPACSIPVDSLVTKRTGQKVYTLRKEIRIFGTSERRGITADAGVLFLVSENGDINAIPAGTELVWSATADELRDLLDPVTED